MELPRRLRVLGHLARESEGTSIEEPPSRLPAPVELRAFVGFHHVGDLRHVDDPLPVHLDDGSIGLVEHQGRTLEAVVHVGQLLALLPQRFDDFRDEARQLPLDLRGVPPLDDVLAREGKVVAGEDLRPEAHAHGETLVVAVPEADLITIVPIGRLQG